MTRQYVPLPSARLIAKAALKRPQSVGCVAGETTYLPMGMALFGILFDQLIGRRPARRGKGPHGVGVKVSAV